MESSNLRDRLQALFRETGTAHHQAYLETDGADPEWPLWYASQMKEPLNQLLGTICTTSELVYLLVMVEKERAAESSPAAWEVYYADFFLQRYGSMEGHMPVAPES